MLRGLKLSLLILFVLKFGIQINSIFLQTEERIEAFPVKAELIQDQSSLYLTDVFDVDEDEYKAILTLKLVKIENQFKLVELFKEFTPQSTYHSNFFYHSDSSPPNWLN